jgi:hypothetical protein
VRVANARRNDDSEMSVPLALPTPTALIPIWRAGSSRARSYLARASSGAAFTTRKVGPSANGAPRLASTQWLLRAACGSMQHARAAQGS